MSFFGGGGGGGSGDQPNYTGLQIQTSSSTLPVAVGWGQFLAAPNIIWYQNFQQHTQSQGGKGLGGGGGSSTSYTADVIMGICEGPISSIARIWQGSSIFTALSQIGLSLFVGTPPQAVWPYLATKYPTQALAYNGLAYVAGASFSLGGSANLPNFNYEIIGNLAGSGANGVDADPALVIQDLITNTQYGAAGPSFPLDLVSLLSSGSASTTGDSAFQTWCRAAGIAFSPYLSSTETALAILQRWATLFNCATPWSGGLLKFIPYGDTQIGSSAQTAHRYWRLIFSGPYNDPQYHQIAAQAIQFRATAGGANIATGGVATSSSSNPPYLVGTVFPGPGIFGTPVNQGQGSWVQYDLGAGHSSVVAEVLFTAYKGKWGPVSLSLAWSDDNQIFTQVGQWNPLTWSDGQTRLFEVSQGFGAIYVPNTTIQYALTDRDFEGDKSADPVAVTITDVTEAKNILRLTIKDRANNYNSAPVEVRDENAINLYGSNPDTSVSADEVCDSTVASTLAANILARGLYIRRQYKFRLGWRFGLLEPMDVVTLTDANLGLSAFPVRIVSIEEDDSGAFTITAEEFSLGVATAATGATQSPAGLNRNSAATASEVNPPIILEPGTSLTGGIPQLWLALSGGAGGQADPVWGGANVYLSTDGTTFAPLPNAVYGAARQGVLSTAIAAYSGANPDSADTLNVDMNQSAGQLISGTAAGAAAGQPLCYVDGELLAFQTATLTGPGQYALTGLYRALNGTTAGAHAAGTQFVRLDSAIYKYALAPADIGVSLFFKFQSFNTEGGGLQDLSTCAVWSYSPTGAGATLILQPLFQENGTAILNDDGAVTFVNVNG